MLIELYASALGRRVDDDSLGLERQEDLTIRQDHENDSTSFHGTHNRHRPDADSFGSSINA